MRKLQFLLSAFVLLTFLIQAVPAHAQATRTWVSGVGDDANPCSRTAPCKTFAGAISKTTVDGEIDCLDPGGFGSVTITKSITFDCHQTLGSILNTGTNGIIVNFDSFASTDVRKTVRLTGLSVQGGDTGITGIRILGTTNSAGSAIFIDQCLVDGDFGGLAKGISDERANGGELYISDTTVRNMNSVGVVVNPLAGASSSGVRINVSIDNIRVQNANFGFAAGSGVHAMISRSVFSGNTLAGIEAEGPFSAAQVNVDNSVTSGNGTGIQNGGGTITIVMSNTNVAFNGTALNGAVQSFGNNRISGNGAIGTNPTLIGSAAAAFGQQ